MKCENCEKIIIPEISYSTVIVLQKVSSDVYTFYQCEDGQEFKGMKWQHFCCSIDCMISMIQSCVKDHHNETNLHEISIGSGSTNLHKIVLASHLECSLCHLPLVDKAYRYCLTFATPISGAINDHRDLSCWCCSLAHAIEYTCNLANGMHRRGVP